MKKLQRCSWSRVSPATQIAILAILALIGPGALAQRNTPEDVRQVLERAAAASRLNGTMAVSPTTEAFALSDGGVIYVQQSGGSLARVASGAEPAFSPDGRMIAFWSFESGNRELWLYDLHSQSLRQLTRLSRPSDAPAYAYDAWDSHSSIFSWSPNGNTIAFALSEQTMPDRSAPQNAGIRRYRSSDPAPWPMRDLFFSNEENAAVRYDRFGERSNIYLARVETGTVTQLTRTQEVLAAPTWSPDGLTLIALRRAHVEQNERAATLGESSFVAIDAATGVVAALDIPPSFSSPARWSPNGRRFAFVKTVGTLGYSSLSVARRDGEPPMLVAGLGPVRFFDWANDDELVLVVAAGLGSSMVRVSADDGRILHQHILQTRVDAFGYRRQSGVVVLVQDDPTSPLHVVAIAQDYRARTLYRRQAGLPRAERPAYLPLQWRNSRGDLIDGMLLLPQSKPGGGKPPVILNPYPGAASWRHNATAEYGVSLLLSRGYAVFWVNARAPHSPTASFKSGSESVGIAGIGANGLELLVDDIESGIDALESTRRVDVRRMCGFGHSNGGATLTQFVTLSSTLRCAVIQTPAVTGGTRPYFRDVVFAERLAANLRGDRPFDNPQAYEALDPLLRLGEVSASTLLIGARQDWTIFDAVDLFNGLTLAGKDSELIVYDQDHHVFGLDSLTDMWVRVLAYFDKHLSTTPPPKSEPLQTQEPPRSYVRLPSGLGYRIDQRGTSSSPVQADAIVRVIVEGTFQTGRRFWKSDGPIDLPLTEVIRGWQEGIPLMCPGDTFSFWIPPHLAYGPAGRPPDIPPNSILIFQVQLLSVSPNSKTRAPH